MKVVRLACDSCGATIDVPEDVENLTCSYCSTAQVVQHGEGYVTLKEIEQVSRTIEEVGSQTQSTIRQETEVTRPELQQLRLSQEISSLQIRLSATRSEIRSLKRGDRDRTAEQHLAELQVQERKLQARIQQLSKALSSGAHGGENQISIEDMETPVGGKDQIVTLILCLCFGWLGAHRFYTGHLVIGGVQFLTAGGFGIWWLIDLLLIATGNYRDAERRPLANSANSQLRGCLAGIATFLISILLCGGIASALDNAIFGVVSESERAGPIFGLTMVATLVLGLLAVLLVADRQLWQRVKERIVQR